MIEIVNILENELMQTTNDPKNNAESFESY
jgi:hypothetical protein